MGGAGNAPTPIQSAPTLTRWPIFAPEVTTEANGKASVTCIPARQPHPLPHHGGGRGRWRQQFGSGESNLTARLPLMVRPSASRFLNFGDQFEMPVVLQNQTDEPMTVDVVAQVDQPDLDRSAPAMPAVTVPANDRVEVRFPGETVIRRHRPGCSSLRFSGELADAAQVSLPVYTPATTEAFATYGVVDEGAIAPTVARPRASSLSSAGWKSPPPPPPCKP